MSTMMMERTGMGMQGMGVSGMGTPAMGAPAGMTGAANWTMVPRCKFKMEKCTGGMKITCSCDDAMACSMVQNLCTMLAGGMCSCCMMMNGMMRSLKVMDVIVVIGGRLLPLRVGGKWNRQQCGERDCYRC